MEIGILIFNPDFFPNPSFLLFSLFFLSSWYSKIPSFIIYSCLEKGGHSLLLTGGVGSLGFQLASNDTRCGGDSYWQCPFYPVIRLVSRSLACLPVALHLSESSCVSFITKCPRLSAVLDRKNRAKYVYFIFADVEILENISSAMTKCDLSEFVRCR